MLLLAKEKRNVGAHSVRPSDGGRVTWAHIVRPYRDSSSPNIHQNIKWISVDMSRPRNNIQHSSSLSRTAMLI